MIEHTFLTGLMRKRMNKTIQIGEPDYLTAEEQYEEEQYEIEILSNDYCRIYNIVDISVYNFDIDLSIFNLEEVCFSKKMIDIENWLNEHCKNKCYNIFINRNENIGYDEEILLETYIPYYTHTRFIFEDKNDALKFKLRWC